MTLKAGIISDTHLIHPDDEFIQAVNHCFADCDVIIHAGDLTNSSVLDIFRDKEVHAVHGNMCDASAYRSLPRETSFPFGRYKIGLTHGAHLGKGIELQLWNLFPEVDCMIYGHTHRAICHRQGGVLIINPGSFRSTGRYGASGTYAIIEAGETLHATLHEVPREL
jgi:putative phosphoesterase